MSSFIPRSLFDQVQPETPDPTYRMSMLPFGTYPNASGSGEHLGLAMPGMIHEPLNALSHLIGTPSNPGTLWNGPDYGSNAENMRTLLETFFGGQATKGAGVAENAAEKALIPLYHGTASPAEFNSLSKVYAASRHEPGVFFAGEPSFADNYAKGLDDTFENGRVFRAYAHPDSIQNFDMYNDPRYGDPFELAIADARDNGKSIIRMNRGERAGPIYMALGPDGLKYQDEVASSYGKLFSDTGKPSLWGAAVQGQQQYPNSLFNF